MKSKARLDKAAKVAKRKGRVKGKGRLFVYHTDPDGRVLVNDKPIDTPRAEWLAAQGLTDDDTVVEVHYERQEPA